MGFGDGGGRPRRTTAGAEAVTLHARGDMRWYVRRSQLRVSTRGGGFTGLPAAFDSHHSDSLRAFCRFVMFV